MSETKESTFFQMINTAINIREKSNKFKNVLISGDLECIRNTTEPVHEKTNNLGSNQARQTGLYSHRRWLEAGNLGFRK